MARIYRGQSWDVYLILLFGLFALASAGLAIRGGDWSNAIGAALLGSATLWYAVGLLLVQRVTVTAEAVVWRRWWGSTLRIPISDLRKAHLYESRGYARVVLRGDRREYSTHLSWNEATALVAEVQLAMDGATGAATEVTNDAE